MGKTSQMEKRLAGRVSLALAAGMFSVVPVAHGMPTFDKVDPAHGTSHDVTVKFNNTAATAGMKVPDNATITSNKKNTIIDWKDFSIEKNHTVNFEDSKNFMNIVTGKATSAIDGAINGTGDIYLINPNGVIFGKTASVNVGNLYVSTREAEGIKEAFLAGNPDTSSVFSSVLAAANSDTTTLAPADVVNLSDGNGHYVAADTVVMEGRNIRFLNIASTTANIELVLRSNKNSANYAKGYEDGYIHVGHEKNADLGDYSVGYVNSSSTRVAPVNGTLEDVGVVNYTLVRDAAGLQAIKDDLTGNYMLANDVTVTGKWTPIGTSILDEEDYLSITSPESDAFRGKFDGMYYTVNGLTSDVSIWQYEGMFGHVKNARIENVGVENTTFALGFGGGIVGYANNSTLLNVWNAGWVQNDLTNANGSKTNDNTVAVGDPSDFSQYCGGIAGYMQDSVLKNAYNESYVSGAGLVGVLGGGTSNEVVIGNSYNIGKLVKPSGNTLYGIFGTDNTLHGSIENTYTASTYSHGGYYNSSYELISGANTTTVAASSSVIRSSSDLSVWINKVNSTISAEGGTGSTWRYYENLPIVDADTSATQLALKKAALPKLTSFFKGVVSTEYTYDKNGQSQKPVAKPENYTTPIIDEQTGEITGYEFTPPTKVYDASAVSIDGDITLYGMGLTKASEITDTDKIISQNTEQNAKTFALLYGGQQGYDLYGNNFTIGKRSVAFTPSDNPVFEKVYDGNLNAYDALASALGSATSGTTGFMKSDFDNYVKTNKVSFGFNNITAAYTDKNVGEDKTVTVSKTDPNQTASVTLVESSPNYKFVVDNYDLTSDLSNMFGTYTSGKITARPVLISLKALPEGETGITKVYDGTSDVVKSGYVGGDAIVKAGTHGEITSGTGGTAPGITLSDYGIIDGKTGIVFSTVNNQEIEEEVTISADSFYANSDDEETKNVLDASKVVYANVVADDNTSHKNNYKFYYLNANGSALVDMSDEDSALLSVAGSITPRTISKENLVLKDNQGAELITVSKTYDGTMTKALESGTTAAYLSTAIIDNTEDPTAGQGSDTGLLATDAANMTFTPTAATFYKADGTTATSFATDNGGATKAGFGVGLTVTDNSILTNYQWSDATGSQLATSVNKMGAGSISKRDVTVTLKWDSGIDKVYDGSPDVKDVTDGNAYATGNYEITSGTLVADATTSSTPTIDISGKYINKNVEYSTDGVTPKAKSIAYTIAISGEAAGNYNLNGTNSPTDSLEASGTITPAPLTVSFADTTKMFDTEATVTTINPTWNGLKDIVDNTKLNGRYVAKDAQGVYQDAVNVGTYDNTVDNAAKAVEYTGIAEALGANVGNYTISGNRITASSTAYGKGYITARKISLEQLKSYLDPKGNLTKTYDATADYTHDMVTANQLAASDYLQVDTTAVDTAIGNHYLVAGAATDIQAVINGKLTIAEAVYRNADGSNAVDASDTPYTNVSMTFNMDGTGKKREAEDQPYYITVGNYDFEWAETFPDGISGTPATTGRTGTITPKGLTVTVADATKIYDGTKDVKANGVVFDASNDTFKSWFTFSGMVGNETVTLADDVTATYDNKNADANGAAPTKRITYSGLALADGASGGKASNYKIVDSNGTTINSITGVGTISKRNVTISDYGVATATKTYDGDPDVEAYALTFDNGNNSTDWAVLAADGITKNADGSENTTGVISYGLTGTYLPTGSQTTPGQGKDVLRDANNRTTILAKNVEYIDTEGETTPLANLFGGNYNVTLANGGTYNSTTGKLTVTGGGKISPKGIELNATEVHATVADKVYDGKTTLANAASSYLTFDSDDINAHLDELTITSKYDSKNAGARTVAYTISMDANNYDLSGDIYDAVTGMATKTGSGTISKKTIYGVVNETPATQKNTISKVYDGYMTVEDLDATAAKELLKTNLSNDGSGAIAITDEDGNLDDISILTTGVTLTYKDANVATSDANDKVTYSGLALTGEDKDNYQLASTTIGGYGTITPKSIAFNITVADGAYKKDYDGKTGLDGKLSNVVTTNSDTLTAAVTPWWNGVRAAGDATTFGDAFETDTNGNLVGYYGVWNPTTKTFTENPNVWADKDAGKKTQDVYYGLVLKGDAAQNYVLANTGGTTGATINVNNTTIQDTVYFQNAMQGKGEIKPLAISMEKVKNEWGTFEKVYDGSASVEGYLVSGAATPTKEQQLTIYYDENNNGVRDKDANGDYTENVTITYSVVAANYVDANGVADANADNGKTIAYTGFSFNDADLDNFVISSTDLAEKYANGEAATKTTGNIARRLLVVSTDKESHEKVYDGNTALFNGSKTYHVARASATNKTAGVVDTDFVNDRVSVTYIANFANADVNFNETTKTVDSKPVTYTFTLKGVSKDNYELTSVSPAAYPVNHDDDIWDAGAGTLTKVEQDGKIDQREVELAFTDDIEKLYDGNANADVSGKLTFANAERDVVAGENISIGDVTATYASKDVAFNANGEVTTQTVSLQNVNFKTGNDVNRNYKVKEGSTGTGTIEQRKVAVRLQGTAPTTKVYDRSESLKGYSPNDIEKVDITTVIPASGIVDGDTLGLSVERALYYDGNGQPTYDAGSGLGVSYRLKWNNTNYSLVKVSLGDLDDKKVVRDSATGKYAEYGTLNTDGVGTITPRTLTYKDDSRLSIDKTYDGTTDIKDASAVATGIFAYATAGSDEGMIAGDEKGLLSIDPTSHYDSPNTGAAMGDKSGAKQAVTMGFQLNNNNYQLIEANTPAQVAPTDAAGGFYTKATFTGTGRIDRAQVTMTPTEVSYYPSQLANATYSGSASGFVNGDARPTMTYGRNGNASTVAGSYTLLGYVNGKQVPVNGETFLGGFENYYFTTTDNRALTILAEPTKPDVPIVPDDPVGPVIPDIPGIGNKPVTQAVTETVISDKKFTPDDYSYNRISKDQDPTHVKRESSASLQYSEKGVNVDDESRSGLAALADIQGNGSVVNLEGALIQTSAPVEQPEKIAEAAALPMPEPDENDISSIDLEYADNTGGQQAVLEILTNASSKAENKGTSIVIDTQDEDEENAEEEKTRRAIFADRSNIEIETLGNAVNLNQMIG